MEGLRKTVNFSGYWRFSRTAIGNALEFLFKFGWEVLMRRPLGAWLSRICIRAGRNIRPSPASYNRDLKKGFALLTIPKHIDALLFDLGGVLIDVDFNRAFENWSLASGIDATLLRSRFKVDDAYHRHERAEISAEQYFAALRNSLGINIDDALFERGWNAILGAEIVSTTRLLPGLLQQRPLYLFSNSNRTHHVRWERAYAGMLANFAEVFVSSEIGLRKPDAEAFLHVASAAGLDPRHILFFDDTMENVDGAKAVGMMAVHVTGTDSIIDAIRSADS
ncbi:MAG: putative haloacid dehalogenase-like hydrolase [Herminiimonas sp.]|nr:putative haloacid dehalogenase-like hydrolase [Herminiimonas sp.]